jgi:signal peptidase II
MLGRGLALAIVVVIADQLAKIWILIFFAGADNGVGPRAWTVIPRYFNLVLTWNRGISFGMFNGNLRLGAIVFVGVAAAIVAGLIWWLTQVRSTPLALAIGFIIGGAVGNAMDRILRGAVVDFLDFHVGQWHPFAFNLADAAISLGVVLLVVDGIWGRRGNET